MSNDTAKPFSELTVAEKEERLSALSKIAIKSLRGSFSLDETEKDLKTAVTEASERVNELSKKLAANDGDNRESYNEAMKDLTKASRKLDKFLDSYEDLRTGTVDKLKDLRSFLDELITKETEDEVV